MPRVEMATRTFKNIKKEVDVQLTRCSGHCDWRSTRTKPNKSFLQILIAARKGAGITQQDLADTLGKPQSFVSKYERQERRLDVVEFITIARAIGLDPSETVREIESRITSRSTQGAS